MNHDLLFLSFKYNECMELLMELQNKDVGEKDEPLKPSYKLRRAARAVVFNDRGEVSLEHATKHNYYKLPGGGIEEGETIEEALRREIREESGVEIKIGAEIGMVIEYRNDFDALQISYAYLADVSGGDGVPRYEPEEIAEGFEPVWVPLDEALRLVGTGHTEKYGGRFAIARDAAILKKAKEILGQ